MAEELTDEGMDDIINAIENGTVGDSIDTPTGTTETADLEDTETTEPEEVATDTEDEADEAELDTDSETDDEVDGEDTQDVEDDVDESESDNDNDEDGVDGDGTVDTDDDVDQSDEEGDEEVEGDENDVEEEVDTTDDTAELDAAKEFYRQAEEVEFMVNGKRVKGLGTIEDMVKARQMAGGLNEKFKAIKELRPFLAPLKDRGLIENPEKFNLAMQIIDGDKEALKQFMHDSGIDPLTDDDMDMGNISYTAKNTLASNEEIVYKDTLSIAKQYGVEEKFNKVVLNDWDSASLNTFFETPETAAIIGAQLSEQIQNGTYDQVMAEVARLESVDVSGTFATKSDIEKYNAGAAIVNSRNTVNVPAEATTSTKQVDAAKVEAAKRKIQDKRKKAAYAKKVEEQKAKADANRKKATAVSTKKVKTAPAKKADPYSLDGEELDSFVNELMDSFR